MALLPAYTHQVKEYFAQLCKTATKGNVTITESWLTSRLQFGCKVCDQTLTTSMPKAKTEVDYQIQEFLKIHAHTGGHVGVQSVGDHAHNWVPVGWADSGIERCSICHVEITKQAKQGMPLMNGQSVTYFSPYHQTVTTNSNPIPLTADFKKVKTGPSEEEIIQKKMEAYNLELLQKQTQAKILDIHAKSQAIELSKAGIAALVEKGISAEELSEQIEAQQAEQALLIEQQKAQQQALQNILTLMDLKVATQSAITSHPVPPKPKPKPKPLKISTGRKFR